MDEHAFVGRPHRTLLALTFPVMVSLIAARFVFPSAWLVAALAQPLNALSFVTDGIHWGTRDYAYLRNAMIAATLLGSGLVSCVDLRSPDALLLIWCATGAWIGVRALFGIVRIWPGFGTGPLAIRRLVNPPAL